MLENPFDNQLPGRLGLFRRHSKESEIGQSGPGIFAAVPVLNLSEDPLLLPTKMFVNHSDLKINDYGFVNLVTFAKALTFLILRSTSAK